MRIPDHFKDSVVFLGYPNANSTAGIECKGTGFLLEFEGAGYLITAKHVAYEFGRDPFVIRVNTKNGASKNLDLDDTEWIEHDDPTVDVAAFPVEIASGGEYKCSYLPGTMLVSAQSPTTDIIGIGSLTYTMGLFRLMSGEHRNLPIVHFGSIAMVPGDERIPIVDWTDAARRRIISVEGYLVGSQSLEGLSGSPVFVRPEVFLNFEGVLRPRTGKAAAPTITAALNDMRILGIWQGAWDAPVGEVNAVSGGRSVRVSVGTGIVVSSDKIIELLNSDKVRQERLEWIKKRAGLVDPSRSD